MRRHSADAVRGNGDAADSSNHSGADGTPTSPSGAPVAATQRAVNGDAAKAVPMTQRYAGQPRHSAGTQRPRALC